MTYEEAKKKAEEIVYCKLTLGCIPYGCDKRGIPAHNGSRYGGRRDMEAVDIVWDVNDGEDVSTLPTEIEIPEGMTDEDDISDYLSETTGFCHKGYALEAEIKDIVFDERMYDETHAKQLYNRTCNGEHNENVKPFKVSISEVLNRTVIIYAESEEKTYETAEELCNAETISLDGSDFGGRTVEVLSVCEKDEINHYRNYEKEDK